MTSITSLTNAGTESPVKTRKVLGSSSRNAPVVSNRSHQASLHKLSNNTNDDTIEQEVSMVEQILATIQDPKLFCFYRHKKYIPGACKYAPCLIVQDLSYMPKHVFMSSGRNTLVLLLNGTFKVVGESTLFPCRQTSDGVVVDSPLVDEYLEVNFDQEDRAQEFRKLESILNRILANQRLEAPSKKNTARTKLSLKTSSPGQASARKAHKKSKRSKYCHLEIGVQDLVEYKISASKGQKGAKGQQGWKWTVRRSCVANMGQLSSGKPYVLLEDGYSLGSHTRIRVSSKTIGATPVWQDTDFHWLSQYRFRDDGPEIETPLGDALEGLLRLQKQPTFNV